LTKAEMMEFYERYIKPGSKTRAKLSVHLKSVATPSSAEGTTTPADTVSMSAAGGGNAEEAAIGDAIKRSEDEKVEAKSSYITDISAWKASLTLSKGPRPVRPLSEMEQTTVKL